MDSLRLLYFTSTLLLAICSLGSSTFVYQETVCLYKSPKGAKVLRPGQKFFLGCKKCVCGSFGKIMCTRERCKHVLRQRPSMPPYRRFISGGFVSPGSRDPRRGQGFRPQPMGPNRSRQSVAMIQKNKSATPKVWLVNSRGRALPHSGPVGGGSKNKGGPKAPSFNSLRMPPLPPMSSVPALPSVPSMPSAPSMPGSSVPPMQTLPAVPPFGGGNQRGPVDVGGGNRLGGSLDTGIPQLFDPNLFNNAGPLDFPSSGVSTPQIDISQQMSIDFMGSNQSPSTGGTSLTQFVDILNRNNFVGNPQSTNNPPVPDFGQGMPRDFLDPGLNPGFTDIGVSQGFDAQITGPGLGFGLDLPPLSGNLNPASGVNDPTLSPFLDSFNPISGGPSQNPSVWDQTTGPSMMDIAMTPMLMDNMVDPFELGQTITSNIKDSPALMAHLLTSSDPGQGQHSHFDPFSGTGSGPHVDPFSGTGSGPHVDPFSGTGSGPHVDPFSGTGSGSPVDPTAGSHSPSGSGGGHFHLPEPTVPSPPVNDPHVHSHPQSQARVMDKPAISSRIV